MDAASTPSIEAALGHGVRQLFDITPIVTILVLIIFGLCLFIRELLKDARNERQLNRDALNNSTALLAEMKGMLYALAK